MTSEEQNRLKVDMLRARIHALRHRLRPGRIRARPRLVNRATAMIAATALAVGISGVAVASIPQATGQVHGCKGKNGAVRIAKTCKTGETAVIWNKQGPAGT
jgi:hypothetical protein